MRALLDSGASQTILGHEGMWAVKKFPNLLKPLSDKWIETADSQKHAIEGSMKAQITLAGRTREINILVVPTLGHSLILGINFWSEMQIVTDFHRKTWDFSSTNPKLASIALPPPGLKTEEHLTAQQRSQLQEFMVEFFGEKAETTLGRTDRVEHMIDTGEAIPVKQRYYPCHLQSYKKSMKN